jgi:hypothetical protein
MRARPRSHRAQKDELEAAWWREHAELSYEPPGSTPAGNSPRDSEPGSSTWQACGHTAGAQAPTISSTAAYFPNHKERPRDWRGSMFRASTVRQQLCQVPCRLTVQHCPSVITIACAQSSCIYMLAGAHCSGIWTWCTCPCRSYVSLSNTSSIRCSWVGGRRERGAHHAVLVCRIRPQEFVATETACTRDNALVRGGLYEVELSGRRMRPCYWAGTHHRTLRGSWFVEKAQDSWAPLKESLADELENAFRCAAVCVCIGSAPRGFFLGGGAPFRLACRAFEGSSFGRRQRLRACFVRWHPFECQTFLCRSLRGLCWNALAALATVAPARNACHT